MTTEQKHQNKHGQKRAFQSKQPVKTRACNQALESLESESFFLFSSDDSSLKRVIELVEKASLKGSKACIISIVGKEPISGSNKASLVRAILNSKEVRRDIDIKKKDTTKSRTTQNKQTATSGQEAASTPIAGLSDSNEQATGFTSSARNQCSFDNQVEIHMNAKTGLIVLNLTSFHDLDNLSRLYKSKTSTFDQSRSSKRISRSLIPVISETWPTLNQNLLKTLLMLFIMSHIVVFYNPGLTLDYSMMQTYKILELFRLKSQTRVIDLLEAIASQQMFSQQWIKQGRVSCPKALFVCDPTYTNLQLNKGDIVSIKTNLQDQIYKLLKKSNVIASPQKSNNSPALIRLPNLYDFVCLLSPKTVLISDNDSTGFNEFHSGVSTLAASEPGTSEIKLVAHDESTQQQETFETSASIVCEAFRKFITMQITDILSVSDHDRKPDKQLSFLPRFDDFFTVLLNLKSLLFPSHGVLQAIKVMECPPAECETSWKATDERRFVDIYGLVDTDNQFSIHHCSKIRNVALDIYKRNLTIQGPPQTMQNSHESSLDKAKSLYLTHARGPVVSANLGLLIQQCSEYRQSLHDQIKPEKSRKIKKKGFVCKSMSTEFELTSSNRHPQQSRSSPSITRQANGIKMTTCCDCGRQSNYMIIPSERNKRLERVEIYQTND